MIIVFDLELTCWGEEDNPPDPWREIIEIGAVKVDLTDGTLHDTFEMKVRPVFFPQVSDYCTQITGLKQEDFKGAIQFREAYAHFVKFCGSRHNNFLAAWGTDPRSLETNCAKHGLEIKHPYEHWNLKKMFDARHTGTRKGNGMGLAKALLHTNITPYGQPHKALCDAINAARVMVKIFHPDREV